jgi:hypothetical protein
LKGRLDERENGDKKQSGGLFVVDVRTIPLGFGYRLPNFVPQETDGPGEILDIFVSVGNFIQNNAYMKQIMSVKSIFINRCLLALSTLEIFFELPHSRTTFRTEPAVSLYCKIQVLY